MEVEWDNVQMVQVPLLGLEDAAPGLKQNVRQVQPR